MIDLLMVFIRLNHRNLSTNKYIFQRTESVFAIESKSIDKSKFYDRLIPGINRFELSKASEEFLIYDFANRETYDKIYWLLIHIKMYKL